LIFRKLVTKVLLRMNSGVVARCGGANGVWRWGDRGCAFAGTSPLTNE